MASAIQFINPPGLGPAFSPYSQSAHVKASEFLFVAGMAATDEDNNFVGVDDFDEQCRQTFANIHTALSAAGASWGNVFQFTSYLVDAADIPRFHAWRMREFPKMFQDENYPTNTLLIISGLVRPQLRLEVQAVAAL